MSDTLAVILVLISAFTVWLWFSFVVARYAERNGQSFLAFVLLGLLVSPFIALIAAVLVGERRLPDPPSAGE